MKGEEMPWVFVPSEEEQATLDVAQEELIEFLDFGRIPDQDRRGFGSDRVVEKPDANKALEIAWSDLLRKIDPPSLPVTLQVVGSVRRENPFTDHKFSLWPGG